MQRQLRNFAFYCLLAIVLLSQVRAEKQLRVKKIDGTQYVGELVAWDNSGLTLSNADDTVTLATSELLRVKWSQAAEVDHEAETFLELVDGTLLPYHTYEVQSGRATITTPLTSEPSTIPTSSIEWVKFMPNAPTTDATELEGDALVIYNKKKDAFDRLDGILGDVSSEKVLFEWDGESVPVKKSKVAAIGYFHLKRKTIPDPICVLTLTNGARLPVGALTIEGQAVQVRTVGALEFSIPLESVLEADYSQDKLVYLSDLKPIRERWTPRIDLPASAALIKQHGLPRRDQSFVGSALSLLWPHPKTGILGGERITYEKGLALRSRTVSRYRVPKGMTRFLTTAGIDPETATEGHVTLKILADKRSLWQGEIAGGDKPIEINVELGSARELRIVVDYGENLDFGDRLHLVEARISK